VSWSIVILKSPTARISVHGSDSMNTMHKFFWYDPKEEMRLFEQQRTHLRNIFVVNSCWRPSTSFVIAQRLLTVFKSLPPFICSRIRWSFIAECLLYHRINVYKRFLKSNTKCYCAYFFPCCKLVRGTMNTLYTAEYNSKLKRPNLLIFCTHTR